MAQRRSGARLRRETLKRLAILGVFFGQESHGNAAAEPQIFGSIDHTHAAASKLFPNPVVRNNRASHTACPLIYKIVYTTAGFLKNPKNLPQADDATRKLAVPG